MARKNVLIIFVIVGIVGGIAFFMHRATLQSTDFPKSVSEQAMQPNTVSGVKHHSNDKTQASSGKAWEDWVEGQVELTSKEIIRFFRKEMPYAGPPEVALDPDLNKKLRMAFEAKAELLKEAHDEPPPLRLYPEYLQKPMGPKQHEGPQTVAALLASFQDMVRADPIVDGKYPQEEWVAMLLEKGATIEHFGHYSRYLSLRSNLMMLENRPGEWTSGRYGIPATNDWETYKASYINRKIWENQQIFSAQKTDPTINGGLFRGPDGKTFLPTGGGRYYVKRWEGSISTYGGYMSEEDKYNLAVHGIEPEGYKIIYLDDNDNVLSEPPPIPAAEFTRENFPEETLPSTLTSEKSFEQSAEDFPSRPEVPPPLRREKSPEEIAARAAKEARQRAHTEFDTLQQFMRTDPDAEWKSVFERSLTPDAHVPSLKQTETILIEKYPKRFEDALNLIYIHGPEEGMRQVKNKDPEVAQHLENLYRARK